MLSVTYVNWGNFLRNVSTTSLIWRANSLVGVITRAPTCKQALKSDWKHSFVRWINCYRHTCIFLSLSSRFNSNSITGITKASVFPLPVTCNKMTSMGFTEMTIKTLRHCPVFSRVKTKYLPPQRPHLCFSWTVGYKQTTKNIPVIYRVFYINKSVCFDWLPVQVSYV